LEEQEAQNSDRIAYIDVAIGVRITSPKRRGRWIYGEVNTRRIVLEPHFEGNRAAP
jgi:hypothetical protein